MKDLEIVAPIHTASSGTCRTKSLPAATMTLNCAQDDKHKLALDEYWVSACNLT